MPLTKNSAVVRKPDWLKTAIPTGDTYFNIKKDLRSRGLHTVCEEAKCPNISECWNTNTATFMLLGDTCTRACRFCHIKTAPQPPAPHPDEARQTSESAQLMNLSYAVLTMVDRDDLEDGGATHVAEVVARMKQDMPQLIIELLAGDFCSKDESLKKVLASGADVFAHNMETVERLTPRVRDARASYGQSLEVLAKVKGLAGRDILTKSAIMLGLGEEIEDVKQTLRDLRHADVDIITLGQYMRPTKKHLSVKAFVHPEVFSELEVFAKEIGFLAVASSPLVRSSYKAHEFYHQAIERKRL